MPQFGLIQPLKVGPTASFSGSTGSPWGGGPSGSERVLGQVLGALGQIPGQISQANLQKKQGALVDQQTQLAKARTQNVQSQTQGQTLVNQSAQLDLNNKVAIQEAAKQGTEEYLKTLNQIDPNLAESYKQKQTLTKRNMEALTAAQIKNKSDQMDLNKKSYIALGSIGNVLNALPNEQLQKQAYKRLLPDIMKINPRAPKAYNPFDVNLWVALGNDNSAVPSAQSPEGKVRADQRSGLLTQKEADKSIAKKLEPDQPKSNTVKLADGSFMTVPANYRAIPTEDGRVKLAPIEGGPADKQSPQDAAKTSLINVANQNLKKVKSLLFNKDGSVNMGNVANSVRFRIPFTQIGTDGIPFSDGRRMRTLYSLAIESYVRAISGAAIKDEEIVQANRQLMPSVFDDEKTIKLKYNVFQDFINGSLKLIRPDGKFDNNAFQQALEQKRENLTGSGKAATPSPAERLRSQAQDAIKRGADPKAVNKLLNQKLKEIGQ